MVSASPWRVFHSAWMRYSAGKCHILRRKTHIVLYRQPEFSDHKWSFCTRSVPSSWSVCDGKCDLLCVAGESAPLVHRVHCNDLLPARRSDWSRCSSFRLRCGCSSRPALSRNLKYSKFATSIRATRACSSRISGARSGGVNVRVGRASSFNSVRTVLA